MPSTSQPVSLGQAAVPTSRTAVVDRASRVAHWFDRMRLDPVLGFLLPGVGDMVSSAVGLFVVYSAYQQGLPRVVIARMIVNLGVDATFGSLPIVGDVFDWFFKAHTRNLHLLEERRVAPTPSTSDWLVVVAAVFAIIGIVAAPVVVLVLFLRWLF